MKKSIIVKIFIGLFLLFLPLIARAEILDQGTWGDNLTWTIDDQEVLTISGTGRMKDFSYIPYEGLGSWNYGEHPSFKHVIVSDGITSIGAHAFSGAKIQSISLPDTLVNIGEEAFYCSHITSISIPDSVEYIGDSAFFGAHLSSATLPAHVETGSLVFSECSGLQNSDGFVIINSTMYGYYGNEYRLEIPDGITVINEACHNETVRQVIMPDSVIRIEACAFSGCRNLISVNFPQSLEYIGSYAFGNCKNLQNILIPENVSCIADDAFAYCDNLCDSNGFVITNGILQYYIGNGGKVYVPEGVTCIGRNAFQLNDSITAVVLPDSLERICEAAFYYTNISTIHIPENVSEIGPSAFGQCLSLFSISVSEKNKYYTAVDGILFNKTKTCLVAFPASYGSRFHYNIPETVRSIERRAFCSCSGLTSVTIPDTVTSIGEGAFSECQNLTSANIPKGINAIPNSMFSYCISLANISIPDNITSIEAYAFSSCPISYVSIPDSVAFIGENAFAYCDHLSCVSIYNPNIAFSEDVFSQCKEGLVLCGYPNSTTQRYAKENDYIFEIITAEMGTPDFICPDHLTIIGEEAFSGMSASIVYIPDSVTSLGSKAFANCINLKQIRIPVSITEIPDDVFLGIPVSQLMIFGSPGSTAETFANSKGIAFEIQ